MNKKEKIEITGMNIKIGKIDLSLSPVEARKLYDVLGEIFEKETIVQKEYVHSYPNYWYYPFVSRWCPSPYHGIYHGSFCKCSKMVI